MEKIKKWVLPSTKNNHHPHVLRPLGLSVVLGLILFSNLGYNYTTARQMQVLGYATSISANEVINLSNQQRAANGISALTYSGQLAQAAYVKAQDMFAKDYWSHYNPEGQGPAYFIASSGYNYSTGGENLAKDFNTSAGVVNAWMNSAGHRANILQGAYVHTGVAVVNGNFQGADTTLVVAMYGAPQATPPPPAPAPVAPTPAPAAPKPPAPSSSQTQATTQPAESTTPTPEATDQSQLAETSPAEDNKTAAASGSAKDTSPPIDTGGQVNGATSESIIMRENLNWAQNSTLVVLSSLLLIGVLKHTLVWRTNRRGWRHIWFRAHPAAQYALILVAIVSTVASSAGAIL